MYIYIYIHIYEHPYTCMYIYSLKRRNRLCTHSVPCEMHFAINIAISHSGRPTPPTTNVTCTWHQRYDHSSWDIYIYIYIRVYIYILIIILFLIFIKNNEWCSWFSWKIRGFMINMKNNDFHDFHIYIYPYLWAYISGYGHLCSETQK